MWKESGGGSNFEGGSSENPLQICKLRANIIVRFVKLEAGIRGYSSMIERSVTVESLYLRLPS